MSEHEWNKIMDSYQTIRTETYLRTDIANALRSIDNTNASVASAVPTSEMEIYRRGFSDALKAVALSFGIDYAIERI